LKLKLVCFWHIYDMISSATSSASPSNADMGGAGSTRVWPNSPEQRVLGSTDLHIDCN